MHSIQINKATGLEGLSARLLKLATPVICTPITHLFNLSLQTSQIPADWKQARVTQIHKGGDRDDVSNYRPISVIPSIMKILEKAVNMQLRDLSDNNLLTPHQSGFRKGYSTNTVLVFLSNYLLTNMDKGRLTGIVCLDIRKALDSVNHRLLLDKLKLYGITGQALSWFESYLVHRAQCTSLLGKKSDVLKLKSGVPQGSILGPLLFTLFMNDLPSVIEHCKVIMYADDTALMYSSSNPREIETCL